MLNAYGFSWAFTNYNVVDENSFISSFKQRVIDCFQQKWFTDMQSNSVLSTLYINIKPSFGEENYLNIVVSKHLRRYITCIRISSHDLRIHSARYGRERIQRDERVCLLCECLDIEDEFHFILKCDKYDDLRQKYVKRYFRERPSMQKFVELLSSTNRQSLLNLCCFLRDATKRRNNLLLSLPRDQPLLYNSGFISIQNRHF